MISIELKAETVEELARKMIEILGNFKIVTFKGKENGNADDAEGDPAGTAGQGNG